MATSLESPSAPRIAPEEAGLRAFHAGEQASLDACYRDHFDTVDRAVGAILSGADRETVVHEVFFRLITDPSLRRAFRGGSLPAWLRVVARNQAIDYARRRRLELNPGGQAE
jgi:RNA polymerase sigma-70 factor (ECF subfamily)